MTKWRSLKSAEEVVAELSDVYDLQTASSDSGDSLESSDYEIEGPEVDKAQMARNMRTRRAPCFRDSIYNYDPDCRMN